MSEEVSKYIFKVLIVGVSNVGKTSLTKRFVHNSYTAKHLFTKGMDLLNKILIIDNNEIQLSMWDTGTDYEYQALMPMYYKGSLGAVIVLDVTDSRSIESLGNWINDIEAYCSHIPLMIALNKIDLNENQLITIEKVEEFLAKEKSHWRKSIRIIKCSAKDNFQVDEIFETLAKDVLEDVKEEEKYFDD